MADAPAPASPPAVADPTGPASATPPAPLADADADAGVVLERVRGLSAAYLQLPAGSLTPAARLVDDLAVDSLAAIEWGMLIEDDLGVRFPDDVWGCVEVYGDLEALVVFLTAQGPDGQGVWPGCATGVAAAGAVGDVGAADL